MAEQMPLAFRVVALQGAAVVLVALGCAVMGSEGRTALLGGLCGVAPNLWMALRVTRGLKDGRELASAVGLFVAQIMKLVFMTLLLGLAFWWGRPIDGPVFFAGFIVALAAHHAALVMTSTDG